MYMSYCRFEGTKHELDACLSVADEAIMGEAEYPVSEDETAYFKLMIENVLDFLQENDVISDEINYDEDKLYDIMRLMERGRADEDC